MLILYTKIMYLSTSMLNLILFFSHMLISESKYTTMSLWETIGFGWSEKKIITKERS